MCRYNVTLPSVERNTPLQSTGRRTTGDRAQIELEGEMRDGDEAATRKGRGEGDPPLTPQTLTHSTQALALNPGRDWPKHQTLKTLSPKPELPPNPNSLGPSPGHPMQTDCLNTKP